MIIFAFPVTALGQSEELAIRLTRDWGYGAGSQIQGKFSLRVDGPEDIVRVEFIIDQEVVYSATESPFRFQFGCSRAFLMRCLLTLRRRPR